jgi:uncharacterized protein (DUF58 family)
VLGILVGSLFARQHLKAAVVTRTAPARTRVGDDIRVGLSIHNDGKKRLPMMRVTDEHEAFDSIVAASERIPPDATAVLEQVRRAHRRGDFEGGPIVLQSGAPFGFVSVRRNVQVTTPVTVAPRWVELMSFPILEPSSFPSDVLHERARTGAGEEYLGVRDYRPGDPPRSVHWRSSARAGHLVVREYEEEVASRVAMVLAGADHGEPPDSSFETLVSAAASIAIYALQTGHPVDLFRYDERGEVAHLANPDRYAVLDWLARARPFDAALLPLASQAVAHLGRRGTIVALAPTAGRAGKDIESTVRDVQSAGSRAIVVAARASTWDGDGVAKHGDEALIAVGQGRAPVKFVSRGEDLRSCLGS